MQEERGTLASEIHLHVGSYVEGIVAVTFQSGFGGKIQVGADAHVQVAAREAVVGREGENAVSVGHRESLCVIASRICHNVDVGVKTDG